MNETEFLRQSQSWLLLLRHLGEAVTKRVDDELQAIRHFELGKDRTEMVRHRGFTDEETFANLLVLETFGN